MGSKTLQNYRDAVRANLMTKAAGNTGHWPDERLDPLIEQARRWTFGEIIGAFDDQDDQDIELTTDVNGFLTLPSNFVREVLLRQGALTDTAGKPVTIIHSTQMRSRHPARDPLGAWPDKEIWRIVGSTVKPVRTTPAVGAGNKYTLTFIGELVDLVLLPAPTTDSMSDRTFLCTVWQTTGLCLLQVQAAVAQAWFRKAEQEAQKIQAEVARRSLSREEQIEDVMGYGADEPTRYFDASY